MKHKILYILLLLTINSKAQSYKIMETVEGDFQGLFSLYDYVKDDVYGYIDFFLMDKIEPRLFKYKFNVLDKNLNKVISKEIEHPTLYNNSTLEVHSADYNNNYIFVIISEIYESKDILKYYFIYDILRDKIITKGIFHGEINYDGRYVNPKNKKFNPFDYASPDINVLPLNKTGFLIIDKVKNPKMTKPKFLKTYTAVSFNGKYLWQKSADLGLSYVYDNSKYIIFVKNNSPKDVLDVHYFHTRTGKELAIGHIRNKDEKYFYDYLYWKFDKKTGKITLIGKYKMKKHGASLGIVKHELKPVGREIKSLDKKYLPYTGFGFDNINKKGKIKKEGSLVFSKMDIHPDGSIFIVAETVNAYTGIYKGLYTILLDKDLNVLDKQHHITENSRSSKYAFSQKLINNSGKAYIFYDKETRKNYKAHIIKLKYDNKNIDTFSLEINLKRSSIYLMPARAGYIMIYEVFKKPKKGEPQAELRFERI